MPRPTFSGEGSSPEVQAVDCSDAYLDRSFEVANEYRA